MAIFKGTGVAIVTPMHEDGKVNFEKLEEILEDQIANSTDSIFRQLSSQLTKLTNVCL